MHQRATTILKVSSEIVRAQEGFFNYGIEYLRPLVRREIAELVGMHESTISRVTTNKYIATPRGIFELRYFFSASLASSGGGMAHSSESVRHRIKALIEAEAKTKPLSDDKIVALLNADGIDVARRTVAKYREQMNIPSSSDRKKLALINP
jgi:RNA polymerase sigma-54 factor